MKMSLENKERAKSVILSLLKHPMVSQSYIAAQLYGADTSSNRSRLNHRTTEKYQWQDWELRRILVVFEELADFVDGKRLEVADIPEMREDFDKIMESQSNKLLVESPSVDEYVQAEMAA